MVLWQFTVIDALFLCQVVLAESLLKKQIPGIGVIPQHFCDSAGIKLVAVSCP